MENTYVVYSEEYYFSMNSLSTILRKKVYTVSYDEERANEVKRMMEEVLQNEIESGNLNAYNEMLTNFKIDTICLEGKYSIDDARQLVVNDDYTWGKVGKNHR